MHSLYIAWQYLKFNPLRTLTIIVCVTVILTLPLALKLLVREAEIQLWSRAMNTPLLIGERGSSMDLVLSSLYFTDDLPALMTMNVNREVSKSELAQSIPIYRQFHAQGFPITATSVDYFSFRKVKFQQGRAFLYLGECVLGATVAARLGLQAGDSLISSSENLFDLASNYPLKMTVAGVLAPAHNADDLAVFVDLKTSWIIAGLGHGHDDLEKLNDPSVILQRNNRIISANAKLVQYNEITAENRNGFHFHGDMGEYPLSAVIVIPNDIKSQALLKGRFTESDIQQQIVDPKITIGVLLERIFQIKKLVDGVTLLVTAAALLSLTLVFALSVRLREREFETLFKLGCISNVIARLLAAEFIFVLGTSVLLGAVILATVWPFRETVTRWLIFY